jgi:ribosomal protein L40E
MHTTVGYLASKPEDFKICHGCGAINWYERERCHSCGGRAFRRVKERDIQSYIEVRSRDEHFCEECEIEC